MSRPRVFYNPGLLQRESNKYGVVMSLILDALNRSQTERGSESDVPGIETQHWVEPLPYAGRWQRGLPWLALGLALLVIVWLLISRNDEAEGASAKVSVSVAERTTIETGPNSTQAEPVEPELPKVISPEKGTVPVNSPDVSRSGKLQEPTDTSLAVASLYSTEDGVETSASVTSTAGASTPEKQQVIERPAAKHQEIEQAIDIETMVNLARQEAENAELSEHSAPFLSQLSQQTKDQVPTIYYTQHDYSSTASQSSVTLNGKLVRAGGSAAGKIKVLEILPNSVVLSDRGTKFRLRALNSWINL